MNEILKKDEGEQLSPTITPFIRRYGNETRPGWHLNKLSLLDYLLVFIAKGSGTCTISNKTFSTTSGDLLWIPPDTPHAMGGDGPAMEMVYLHFDLQYDPARSHWNFPIPVGTTNLNHWKALLHPPLNYPPLDSLCGRLRGHTNKRVGEMMKEICIEAARTQSFSQLRMSGLMQGIVAEILRGQLAMDEGWTAHIPTLERIAEEIDRRCGEPLTIAELARAHRISPSYLRNLFTRQYNCSPRTYLRRSRIRKARSLMTGTNLTLSEIAAQTGFETIHSFSRAFKAVEGCAPSTYRRTGATR